MTWIAWLLRATGLFILAGFVLAPAPRAVASPTVAADRPDEAPPARAVAASPAGELADAEPLDPEPEEPGPEDPPSPSTVHPISAARPLPLRTLGPNAATALRSRLPVYRVRRSGQAHRSAP